jgi:hypothetical protein
VRRFSTPSTTLATSCSRTAALLRQATIIERYSAARRAGCGV